MVMDEFQWQKGPLPLIPADLTRYVYAEVLYSRRLKSYIQTTGARGVQSKKDPVCRAGGRQVVA